MQAFFEKLHQEKMSVDSLSSYDLLRRDYKEFSLAGHSVGTSSLPCTFASWAKRADLPAEFRKYAAQRHLEFLVVNTAAAGPSGAFQREFAFYKAPAVTEGVSQRLRHHLESSELGLTPLTFDSASSTFSPTQPGEQVVFYQQKNVVASRKQIVPILSSFFSAL